MKEDVTVLSSSFGYDPRLTESTSAGLCSTSSSMDLLTCHIQYANDDAYRKAGAPSSYNGGPNHRFVFPKRLAFKIALLLLD